jgi:hypothetical protein
LEELFEAIVEEGEALHRHAVRSERMNQPFLPYKQKEGTKDTSKDNKSKDHSVKGGGTARKACTNCGKYHEGVCNAPKKDAGSSRVLYDQPPLLPQEGNYLNLQSKSP